MRGLLFSTLLLIGAAGAPSMALAAKVDAIHSGVMFKAQHFGAGYTWGRFKDFDGTVEMTGNKLVSMNIEVKTNSVDTEVEKRDKHLMGPDFFDAEKYGTMTFTSSKVTEKSDGVYEVMGDLTLHGVKKAVTVEVRRTGEGDLPVFMGGAHVTGWECNFSVKQSDHGMKYDGVGDVVYLYVNLEVKN